MSGFLFLVVVAAIVWMLFRSTRPLVENTEGHWHKTVPGLLISTTDLYNLVEKKLGEWKVPNLRISRVEVQEGWAFSDKRLYFRVQRDSLAFDIFAAPFGGGTFVSTWLWRDPSIVLTFLGWIPFVGLRLVKWLDPVTYYALDTATLFQEITHNAVLETLDELTANGGLPRIPEGERRPVMGDLYKFTIRPKAPIWSGV